MEELIFMDASNKILNNQFAQLPSVDYVIQHHSLISFQKEYGLSELTKVTRLILSEVRHSIMSDSLKTTVDDAYIFGLIEKRLETRAEKKVRAVLNLTGTVLHTNLGRAILPQ
jgi:L-seryl-tRNA(Ser) seleniumtransferase